MSVIRRIGDGLERLAAERPVLLAFLVFMGAASIIIPLSFPFYQKYPQEFLVNVLSEAHGMVFDLLVIGWFIFWLRNRAERTLENKRYREEIEDFLGWKSPEATHRIAGNIRRLNRNGVVDNLRLTDAHLKGANLQGAFLKGADLWGANLDGANLVGADLRKTSLAGAHLEAADMERVRLALSDLRGATLRDADLERGDLSGVDFRGSLMVNTDLQYSTLTGANLERTDLERSNLRGANLKGACLNRANLQQASLRNAILDGAEFHRVALEGADFTNASLLGTRLPTGDELVSMFENTRSLYGARFDPEVGEALRRALPHLFQSTYPRMVATKTTEKVPQV